jgi:hypothetical protein
VILGYHTNEVLSVNIHKSGFLGYHSNEVLSISIYKTKLCRTLAEVILNHVNPNVHGIGQGEAMHRKYKRFKLGGSQA